MLKKILEQFEKKIMEQSVQIPLTITIDVGDQQSNNIEPPAPVQPAPKIDHTAGLKMAMSCLEPTTTAECEEDARVLAAIDDYFKTLNDGQYSPFSGEHNNASNNTEVYQIARKHGVDPAKLMKYLSDTAIFDKFQGLAISEAKKGKRKIPPVSKEVDDKRLTKQNPVAKNMDKFNKPSVVPPKPKHSRKDGKNIKVESKNNKDVFGKKTMTPDAIAKKHGVSVGVINRQLKIGIPTEEKEHGAGTAISRETALDHLAEKPDYYTELAKMEEGYKIRPPINADRYPNREHEGLEGPWTNKHGKVYYYDTKEGKYYDPDSDMYMEVSDVKEGKNSAMDAALNKFSMLTEGKEMSDYEYHLISLLDSLGVDYMMGQDGVMVPVPYLSNISKSHPEFAGLLQHAVHEDSCGGMTSGGTSAGNIAGISKPMGNMQRRKT